MTLYYKYLKAQKLRNLKKLSPSKLKHSQEIYGIAILPEELSEKLEIAKELFRMCVRFAGGTPLL